MSETRGSAGLNGETHPPGTPCRASLMTHGTATAQDFYGALFGWEFQQLGPHVRALLDGHDVAAISQLPTDRHLPAMWTTFLASDDVDLTAEMVRHCGGTVGVGPLDVDDASRMALASDPSGALFGIWHAASHLGSAITGAPGTPAWNELLTRDSADVTQFYGTVFGYEEEAVASTDVDYVTLHVKGHPVAGIHGVGTALPHDRGPHWLVSFEVTDTDEAVEHVTDLGGHLLTPARNTPHGRVAKVMDPEGAVFCLVRSPS